MSKKMTVATTENVAKIENGNLMIIRSLLTDSPVIIKTDKKTGKEVETGRIHVVDYKPIEFVHNGRTFRLTVFCTTDLNPEKKQDKPAKKTVKTVSVKF